ncbi:melanization protease 1-like [Drosophila ficusphila]|uniref:melanization protease 1-like n=1 Tax=Drosophila ficusphila TaxID=30025 RepID=UPI0007E88F40|nr:melanization protease 1-like [Drosophila ficusphila]
MFADRMFLIVFGVLPAFLMLIQAQEECGKLRESQLYDRNEITAPDEYTWIGRVGYEDSNNASIEFHCLAVLIHQRYAILPAHCVLNIPVGDATFILFGDWHASSEFKVGDCRQVRDISQCTTPPQAVDIEELVVHPRYKVSTVLDGLNYNIALAKLERSVVFSDFVQPICLPPAGEDKDKHIGQRLEWAGFKKYSLPRKLENDEKWRSKVQLQIASREFCNSKIWNLRPLFENHLCSVGDNKSFLSWGSPLMAFEVVNGKPRNFYLVGIQISTTSAPGDDLDSFLFMRVHPFRNWILNNIKYN